MILVFTAFLLEGMIMDSGFMHQFAQQLINGLSLGSIYALIALGYTMIYGILKLINFAHGDIYMVGAYIGYFCTTALKLPFLPSIVIAMAGAALVGMLVERIAYRPMRHAPRIAILITAIGVSFFLENGMILLVSPQPRTFPAVFSATVYHLGGLVINNQQILILVSTVVLMVLLTYIVNSTNLLQFHRSAYGHDPGHQGFRCRCTGRHRHHPRCHGRRHHPWYRGGHGIRLHFLDIP